MTASFRQGSLPHNEKRKLPVASPDDAWRTLAGTPAEKEQGWYGGDNHG